MPLAHPPAPRTVRAGLLSAAAAALLVPGLSTGPALAAPAPTAAPRAATAATPAPSAMARLLAAAGAPAAHARSYARTVARLPAAGSAVLGTALTPGDSIAAGDSIRSASARYSLVMDSQGELTYQQAPNRLNPAPLSRSFDSGDAGAHLDLQLDGNLVLYNAGGSVATDFDTAGSGAQELVIQDDGNLVLYGAAGSVVLNFALTDDGFLEPGQVLLPGDTRRSYDLASTLTMQTDGNLVLYEGSTPVFSTGTFASPGAAAIQQTDGNFVVYSDASPAVPLFSTGSANGDGDRTELDIFADEIKVLAVVGDSIESLYGSAWGSDTVGRGQILFPGDRRVSPAGTCLLAMQSDGNLVDYCAGRVVFNARTSGLSLGFMQTDGNFVIVELLLGEQAEAVVTFQTRTAGHPGSELVVQDDRNLVVYTPQGRPVFRIR